jgi:predicted permease
MPDRRFRPSWPHDIARDVDEEIASHLAERQDEYLARGLDPDAAADAARRRFGDRQRVADLCRGIDRGADLHERWRQMLTDLRQDAFYALRLFRRSRGFAVTATLTLALGIGATTAIFTLANWALLRPVPGVADPRNVAVFWVGRHQTSDSFTPAYLSYPNLTDVVARVQTMTLAGYGSSGGPVPVAGNGQAARPVYAQYADGGYFTTLGVAMQIGRPFTAAEDRPPSPFLGAVISNRLWQSMFQRSPDVLQQTLQVAGVRFAILGVAPRGFHGTERISMTDLWLPGAATPIVMHTPARYDTRTRGGYYELVARLKPNATWPQAQAELESLRAWLRETYPGENGKFAQVGFHFMGPIGPRPSPLGRDAMTRVIGVAAGSASALVLLIACANVAGLLLVRGVQRRGEVGIRKALGASRARLVRQHVAEGLLLWTAGGLLAVTGVLLLTGPINPASLLGFGTLDLDLAIDWRVLAFSAAVSLVVGVLSAIGPALRATRVEAVETLRAAGSAATRRSRAGHLLAVLQLGAALTLLIGAYLLSSTLVHLWRVPLGFEPAHTIILAIEPAWVGYTQASA